jgi:hypothetical protein
LYVPPNLRFEINDAEDEWNFSEDPRSQMIQQAYKSLAPGGYLEIQDGSFPFKYVGDPPVDSAFYKWNQLVSSPNKLSTALEQLTLLDGGD